MCVKAPVVVNPTIGLIAIDAVSSVAKGKPYARQCLKGNPERASDLWSCCVTTNSPSGKRLAVGRSTTPGSPKLPAVTCRRVSLAAEWGKFKNVETIKIDKAVIIDLPVCWDINGFKPVSYKCLSFCMERCCPKNIKNLATFLSNILGYYMT